MKQNRVMRNDHKEVEEKYNLYREIVFEEVEKQFPGVIAKGIVFKDCVTADSWKKLPVKSGRVNRGTWDWKKEFPYYQNRPNRFEISLWRSGVLCALCYGQTSKHGSKVRMNLIESIPIKPTPLGRRALPVLGFAAATFAEIIGATELWVIDPDPEIEYLYKDEGFGDREVYHGRRIGQRRLL